MLQTIEKEKVQLMVKTLKPTLAFNTSFDQEKELEKILSTILDEKNIKKVKLTSKKINKILKKQDHIQATLHYRTSIKDPFSNAKIATIEIFYSNENLLVLYKKIITTLIIIFLFASIIFIIFYVLINKELTSLKYISDSLLDYSKKQKYIPLRVSDASEEISTISTTANNMMYDISKYVKELKSFNTRLEEQVKEKVEELHTQEKILIHQSRQAAMGEMLESIAHQWRQPLNIIGLSSASLETEYALGIMSDTAFSEKMEIISTNINYMSDTIDDFRNFLNPSRELNHFNPHDTLKDVLKILDAQLSNNNINLEIKEENQIELFGIENEFKQVLFILLNNAKDAIKTQQSEKSLQNGTITITLFNNIDTNILSFCDNGGGIKEEIINNIFDPYFTTKFASSGTGIGLYMAKNIIESRMEGSLRVHNTNKGCCFTIKQSKKAEENI